MVSIQQYQSPLGGILLAADEVGLVGLWFEGQKYFANTLPVGHCAQTTPILAEAKRWLDIYFAGKEPDFLPPLHPVGSSLHKSARVCHLHGLFPPFRRRFSATLSGLLATRTIFLNNERGTSKNAVTTFKEVHRNDGLQENSYASKYGVQPTRNGTQ